MKTLRDIDRPYWDGACKQLAQQLDREIMTKDNPLHVVVTESALPYVALVLYAAQQVESSQPAFARQMVEAARYFEGLMLKHKQLEDAVSLPLWPLRDAADRREPRR